MKLTVKDLAQKMNCPFTGDGAVVLDHISHQSKDVSHQGLYVALAGRQTHGIFFLNQALAQGVSAIALPIQGIETLSDHRFRLSFKDQTHEFECFKPIIWLDQPRKQLAWLAEYIYGCPAQKLKMIGVTGTNGKTTTTTLIADLLEAEFGGVGLLGTVVNRLGKNQEKSSLTTPESPQLHRILKGIQESDYQHCVMEVSSIGIEEERVSAIPFECAAFSNLTEDHLDYHGSFENYFQAKAKLFSQGLKKNGLAIINMDDPWGEKFKALLSNDQVFWALRKNQTHQDQPQVYWENLCISDQGIEGILHTPLRSVSIKSPLVGAFNAYNIATAVSIAIYFGVSDQKISDVLMHFEMKGRMQKIKLPADAPSRAYPHILVDYAHTPDALINVLQTLKPLVKGKIKLIFGCGGDRDKGKRPRMGEASALADMVIISNDNPRSEDPSAIAQEILAGALSAGLVENQKGIDQLKQNQVTVVLDRKEAITSCIISSQEDDFILIAGKGHESYQEINGIRYDFDDAHISRKALEDQYLLLNTVDLVNDIQGEIIYGNHQNLTGVSIDTRSIQPKQCFFCLKQQRDAHEFIPQALQAGASCIVVSRDWQKNTQVFEYFDHLFATLKLKTKPTVIACNQPLWALQLFAKAHRLRYFHGTLIGLTGSNGKTTTKEMLYHCLKAFAPTLATKGNLNNHLGVPLTLLRLKPSDRYAVIEMGMNALNEISFLAQLSLPSIALITTIGRAHLEGLKTIENIAKAKGEIFEALPKEGHAFFLSDLPYKQIATLGLKAHRHEIDDQNWHCFDQSFTSQQSKAKIQSPQGLLQFEFPLSGEHHLKNALLVLAVIDFLGLDLYRAVEALKQMPIPHLRGEISVMKNGQQLWLDCYNANPQSMMSSITAFINAQKSAKILVLGELRELGESSESLHFEVGEFCAKHADAQTLLFTFGQHAQQISLGALAHGFKSTTHFYFDEIEKLADAISQNCAKESYALLIKGSRGASLERLLPLLKTNGTI